MLFWYRRLIYFVCFFKNKTDRNLVLFQSFAGRNYSDNPKALYLEMLNDEKYSRYKLVWSFIHPEKYDYLKNNSNTDVVKFNSKEYKRYISKAAYWITNSRLPDYLIKKRSQTLIQCWHGTPFKRLGHDVELKGENAIHSVRDINKKYDDEAKRCNVLLSPSPFCTEKFTSAFRLKKHKKEHIILEEGYPRNDFLFKFTENDVKRVKNQFNIPSSKKVILYAPTWRDNQHQSGLGYTYKLGLNFDLLQEQVKDEYVILCRTHYFISNSFDFGKYKDFVYDVSKYDDISELYAISDMLITDYSSVFFDYANLRRPMLFYMYDLDEYKNKLRDFYFDLNLLPGPIVQEEEKLINEIKTIDTYWDNYSLKYNEFRKIFNPLDGKECSKRILEKTIDTSKG